ncbi:MAG: GIY-YIG nuclease family protein [Selenomonadaceae bacterium]
MLAYTYIVECADGSLYTGWTNDVEKRLAAHNAKKGAKYTRTRIPVKLRYIEKFLSKQEAQRREWQIKKMSRAAKFKLIAENEAEL